MPFVLKRAVFGPPSNSRALAQDVAQPHNNKTWIFDVFLSFVVIKYFLGLKLFLKIVETIWKSYKPRKKSRLIVVAIQRL